LSEEVLLALIAAAATILSGAITNWFAMKRLEIAVQSATATSANTHAAINQVAAVVADVHATVVGQPDRANLKESIAALQSELTEAISTGAVAPAQEH
jgi:hypothetical protein